MIAGDLELRSVLCSSVCVEFYGYIPRQLLIHVTCLILSLLTHLTVHLQSTNRFFGGAVFQFKRLFYSSNV